MDEEKTYRDRSVETQEEKKMVESRIKDQIRELRYSLKRGAELNLTGAQGILNALGYIEEMQPNLFPEKENGIKPETKQMPVELFPTTLPVAETVVGSNQEENMEQKSSEQPTEIKLESIEDVDYWINFIEENNRVTEDLLDEEAKIHDHDIRIKEVDRYGDSHYSLEGLKEHFTKIHILRTEELNRVKEEIKKQIVKDVKRRKEKEEGEHKGVARNFEEQGVPVVIVKDYQGREMKFQGGAVNNVYLGKIPGGIHGLENPDLSAPLQEVVIKVPKPQVEEGIDPEGKRIKEEENTLKRLRGRQQILFPGTLPHFPEAKAIMLNGLPALIMEPLPPKTEMYSALDEGRLPIFEVPEVMVQFFEAITVAHSLDISVNDKKGGDYYYDPKGKRFVLLDWNVIHEGKEENEYMDRYGWTKYKTDLFKGLEIFSGINQFLDSCAFYKKNVTKYRMSEELVNKIKILMKRIQNRDDKTRAMDMIDIMRNISNISEEDLAKIKI